MCFKNKALRCTSGGFFDTINLVMKSNRKTFLLSYSASLFSFALAFAAPVAAQTTTWSGACVGGYDGTKDVATIQGIECLVGNVLSVAITIIGIAAFVMFLIGSFRYMTAGSNSKGVESGKSAISFAVLGIVVALASYVILRFLSDFTGVTSILNFSTQIAP